MAKLKAIYVCSNCGIQYGKWSGSCADCGEWNTLVEDVIDVSVQKKQESQIKRNAQITVRKLSDLDGARMIRVETGIKEFDRVLGGGMVPGSLVLLAGEPGIGKSTLMLQVLAELSQLKSILYVAGEESVEQIGLRSDRLSHKLDNVDFLMETDLDTILGYLAENKPDLIVVDSVSVIYSESLGSFAGSIPQVRAVTEGFMQYAKQSQTPVLLVGHVTKDGSIAGPKVMEHLVDVVLHLEGDRYEEIRLLRALKNRFGSTQEVGVFQMDSEGLQAVESPGQKLLKERTGNVIGSALTVTIDGRRPFVLEVQALVSKSYFGYPKRSATGFDLNRLHMLIAVLEKYHGLKLGEQDVFVNVVGGIKIKEPGCDLAVMEAIKSSFKKEPLDGQQVFIGEVGLDGKVRDPYFKEIRLKEVG